MSKSASQQISKSASQQVGKSANRALAEAEDAVGALLAAAVTAQAQAYAPYSHFRVGAALQGTDGAIYVGCNVENASYGLTICAERNAVAHAVARGARKFTAIAVVTLNGVSPCGACRQVLAEFNPQMTVILMDAAGNRRVYSLADLLPAAFGPDQLPVSAFDR